MGNFFGLEIGKRSIMTHQTLLSITGHNVANANTPGYTRQMAEVVTTPPFHAPVLFHSTKIGQLGTGVQITAINRLRDAFVDAQIRHENKSAGYWESLQNTLDKVEVILNEPSKDGLRGVMDKFWESWQTLSLNPESEAARSVTAQRGMALAEAFNHTYRQLKELREDVNMQVQIKVDEINSLGKQIADLNRQIMAIVAEGKQPNDLMDKRDLLLDQLSKIANIAVHNRENGLISVDVGDGTLVEGIYNFNLTTRQDEQGMHLVTWEETGLRLRVNGGEIRGLLDARGQTSLETGVSPYKELIPTMLEDLNQLARTIILRTNDLHRGGYTLNNKANDPSTPYSEITYPDGINFFTMPAVGETVDNWAKFMSVNPLIEADPKNIAAASHVTWGEDGSKLNFGDGANALKIARLKHDLNRNEYQFDLTDLTINFPNETMAGYLTIQYTDPNDPLVTLSTVIEITAPGPGDNAFKDLTDLAQAIQKQLDSNTDLKTDQVPVYVRCDGRGLTFYSPSASFVGVADGDVTDPAHPLLFTVTATFQAGPAAPETGLLEDMTGDDFWRSLCADVGVQSQEAQRMLNNEEILLNQLENKRQSLSGVSLDEEMTNMIKFQHAYNAGARFITTIDEQIDVIINRMGLVGR